eukprot:5151051-Amphidinium_carterae.1
MHEHDAAIDVWCLQYIIMGFVVCFVYNCMVHTDTKVEPNEEARNGSGSDTRVAGNLKSVKGTINLSPTRSRNFMSSFHDAWRQFWMKSVPVPEIGPKIIFSGTMVCHSFDPDELHIEEKATMTVRQAAFSGLWNVVPMAGVEKDVRVVPVNPG